ncbi:succinate semialdehyde dehydrogenase [Clavulina sp. PMI_390]|nr:succinate semialdehyde dehydrogenase [Clavulina sp. PMI_390]
MGMLRVQMQAVSRNAFRVMSPVVGLRFASSAVSFALKDSGLIRHQSFVGGKWVHAKDGATFRVTNPANDDFLGTVPDMGVADAKEAVEVASHAFKTWSKTTAKSRHDILRKLYDLMMENSDDLARIITIENGKTLAEAKGEATYSASYFEVRSEEAVRSYGENIPSAMPGLRNVVIKQPVGVCSILTPWNFPSAMLARKIGPALAAGCTIVVKPPAETPFSAIALAELAARAGLPEGVFNIVTTDKNLKEVGKELCENPIVKKVSFTGSTPIGKLIAGQAAGTLKKVSIEAGGNAPFIVFDDADIDAAVDGAMASKFRQAGQTCVCANRLYVQSSVYADFASKLADRVDKFRLGNGLDKDVTMGPLIHGKAISKVDAHVQDAISRGAQVLVGGKPASPNGKGIASSNFYLPTVLADVHPDSMLCKDETFGPLAGLVKFETEEEVIRMANDTEVGLAGYFYSRDVGRVWRVAEALEVGMIGTNTGLISQAVIPFGGVKESGLGREGGPHGIEEYQETKLIAFGGLA